MKKTIKNIGIYENLIMQIDKVRRHARQGSHGTRHRYYGAMRRFCVFLAENFRLQKLSNIDSKHLEAYAKHMQERNLAPSTIKTDLASIRYFYDQISGANNYLPGNSDLNLQKRKFGGVDRTWEFDEFVKMVNICLSRGHSDYVCTLYLGYFVALRLEECFSLDTSQAEKAIKTGVLTVKGKGGLVRDVPLNEKAVKALAKMLEVTPRGQKLFVAPDDKTHKAMNRVESFINYHRSKVQNGDSEIYLTFHGLRHTCAANWYKELRAQGKTKFEARKQVSTWLGHSRDDVTRIYLASVEEGDDECQT